MRDVDNFGYNVCALLYSIINGTLFTNTLIQCREWRHTFYALTFREYIDVGCHGVIDIMELNCVITPFSAACSQ